MSIKTNLPLRAWAIVHGGALELYDHRLPICWLKSVAERERKKKCLGSRVVPVVISLNKTKKRGGK